MIAAPACRWYFEDLRAIGVDGLRARLLLVPGVAYNFRNPGSVAALNTGQSVDSRPATATHHRTLKRCRLALFEAVGEDVADREKNIQGLGVASDQGSEVCFSKTKAATLSDGGEADQLS